MGSIRRFFNDETGADLIEYALLAGLISLACAVTLGSVGTSIKHLFERIAGKIDEVTLAPTP